MWGDISLGILGIVLMVKGYIGYLKGNSGFGFNGISVVLIGEYVDWMLGVDYMIGLVMFGVFYVDIDIM